VRSAEEVNGWWHHKTICCDKVGKKRDAMCVGSGEVRVDYFLVLFAIILYFTIFARFFEVKRNIIYNAKY